MLRVVVGVAMVMGCWSSSRPAPPLRETVLDLSVEQAELANGLRLVVVRDPGTSETFVTMRYGVGSADDPAGREGLAHLAEHVMFEHVRDGEAAFDFLERQAIAFTGFTSLDATVFHAAVPAPQLAPLLALEQTRMTAPCDAIPEAAFLRQREIVRNELRERDADDEIAHALHAGVFGAGPARATPASVAALTQAEVCAFAARRYGPEAAVLVVSGPVSLAEVRPLVEAQLGGIARRGAAPRPPAPVVTKHAATIDVPTDRPWFVLAWPLPLPRASAWACARSRAWRSR